MNDRQRISRRLWLALLLAIVVVVAGVILATRPQTTGRIFSNITTVTCIYQVKVTVFTDDNGDGIQNSGEKGLAGAMVTLEHSKPPDTTPEAKTTDANGSAQLNADKYCPVNDLLTVRVTPPSGYTPTTPLIFGPYPVPEMTNDSMTAAAAHPIPDMISVGLQGG